MQSIAASVHFILCAQTYEIFKLCNLIILKWNEHLKADLPLEKKGIQE